MPVDPSYFIMTKDLRTGDRVWFERNRRAWRNEVLIGTGTIEMIWMGIEEMVDIQVHGLGKVTLCRALGDTIEVMPDAG